MADEPALGHWALCQGGIEVKQGLPVGGDVWSSQLPLSSMRVRPLVVIHQTAIFPRFLLATKPRLSRLLSRLFVPLRLIANSSSTSAVQSTGSEDSKNTWRISRSLTSSGLPGTGGLPQSTVKVHQNSLIKNNIADNVNLTFNTHVVNNENSRRDRGPAAQGKSPFRNDADPEFGLWAREASCAYPTEGMKSNDPRGFESLERSDESNSTDNCCPASGGPVTALARGDVDRLAVETRSDSA